MLFRLALAIRIVFRLFQAGFLVVWAVVVAGITAVSRIFTSSTDDKLRQLGQPDPANSTTALTCPQCATQNESNSESCFACGALMIANQQSQALSIPPIVVWAIAAILFVAVLIAIL